MIGKELEELAAVVEKQRSAVVLEKQRSAAVEAEQLETWRDAVVGRGEPVPVRQWQLGGSVPEDEEALGSGEQRKLAVRRLGG